MSVSAKSSERYSSPEILGTFIHTEWGDILFRSHSAESPPSSLADAERFSGSFYSAAASLVDEWWGQQGRARRICDVGGATGRLLYELSQRMFGQDERVLLEPSDLFCMWARRFLCGEPFDGWVPMPRQPGGVGYRQVAPADLPKPLEGVVVHCAAAHAAPRPPGHFDLVTCLNVVDRVPDPNDLVTSLSRLVRRDGMLVLASPLDFDPAFTDQSKWVTDLGMLLPTDQWSIMGQHWVSTRVCHTSLSTTAIATHVTIARWSPPSGNERRRGSMPTEVHSPETSGPDVVVIDGFSLGVDQLVRVARLPETKVVCSAESMERVQQAHQRIRDVVGAYELSLSQDGGSFVGEYGVTTGFGEFKDVRVDLDELSLLQRNLLLSHATGIGESPDRQTFANYLPAEVVRATLLVRINAFLRGNSGINPTLLTAILEMLNSGVVPLVPIRGSVGSSGDLCPLAHLFVVLLGEGSFYVASSKTEVSCATPGAIFPGSRLGEFLPSGLPANLIGPKDGLALINGATVSAAILTLAVHDAEQLADAADVATGLTLEAICGCTDAFHPAVHEARPFHGQIVSARNVRCLTHGSRQLDRAEAVQDAYSLRCAPQVHGASREAIAYARRTAEVEINAATDNPLLLPADQRLGSGRLTCSAGNFHGQPVAFAADFLGIAVAELANISERRTQMLLDGHHNRNLPPNLTARPGLNSGMMIAQYAAASLVSENKVLAHPASVDSIPTSANSEDHVSMATIAARKARTILSNAQAVVAIEMLAAVQAVDWRVAMQLDPRASTASSSTAGTRFAERQERRAAFLIATEPERRAGIASHLGAGSREAYAVVRQAVAPLVDDRPMDVDIAAVWQLVRDGAFTHALTHAYTAAGVGQA